MMPSRSHTIPFISTFVLSSILAGTVLLLGTDITAGSEATYVFMVAIIVCILPFLFLPVWFHQEKRGHWERNRILWHMEDILAAVTAFCLSIFSWKKILHLQFQTPMSIADLPMSVQSGETLTWYYFGFSPAFSFIIALLQMIGACLLFFRRTRLTGLLMLLPIMLNITLINVF